MTGVATPSAAGDTPEARMVGQGRGNRSGLGASGGSHPPPGRAGSRRWRYGV